MSQPKSRPNGPADKRPLLVKGVAALGLPISARSAWVLGWVQALGIAALLAWVMLTFVIIRMTVPTGSMEPTIQVGTSFFVDKLSFHFRDPTPGDIVVFWRANENTGERERLVKRLIAVGGQTVRIADCRIEPADACGVVVDGQLRVEPPFDHGYVSAGRMGSDEWTVPEGEYFVLGDHTQISEDSRYWGFVPRADVIGEPFLRVWPPEQIGFMNGYLGSPR